MITLRPLADGDALGLLLLEQALVDDGRGMVKTRADLPDSPIDIGRNVSGWLLVPPFHGVRYVLEDARGRVVGEGQVRRFGQSLLRHGGLLALGVHPDCQGQGLGRRLLEALLQWADAPGPDPDGVVRPLSRVELYVRADNPRAIALYESAGFVVEGRRVGFVRLDDGTLIDDLVMARRRGPDWPATPAP